ncbi:MAG: hypothetical protein TR69_WS6001001541 [candidate division WS6 bacterium OLB20]|uniref:Uncharacterized protein n=1 Tax=candidate division WS6 bacterium OLB20 TaxID=1617426 RepID=A0A136LVR6_9BACT|nr:MAG: hypothetical protein TR69_WS6001001541 [candidate division WS6 bacterium OLB20]
METVHGSRWETLNQAQQQGHKNALHFGLNGIFSRYELDGQEREVILTVITEEMFGYGHVTPVMSVLADIELVFDCEPLVPDFSDGTDKIQTNPTDWDNPFVQQYWQGMPAHFREYAGMIAEAESRAMQGRRLRVEQMIFEGVNFAAYVRDSYKSFLARNLAGEKDQVFALAAG